MPVLKTLKNGVWEPISGMSAHTHTKDDIKDFPSSLPADGGNADTLDGKHADEFALSSDIPSTEGLATEVYVDQKVAAIVDSAPETLNTLNELAAALGNDENFASTVARQIGSIETKVGDKSVSEQITDAVAQKSQVQIITWEADD